MKAPDGSCRSCHFRDMNASGTVCTFTGDRVKVDDPNAGTCAAWTRYFDSYMQLDADREPTPAVVLS